MQHFSSSDACSCIFIIFILWRKSIAWRYQSLFSDCFPQEQASFHSKRVIGFCFSRQQTREGLQKPQGLRANSCSSALSLCFLPHYTGSCLGLKKPSLHSSLHYRLPEKWDVDGVSVGCQQSRGSSSLPSWIQQNGSNQWTSRYNPNVVGILWTWEKMKKSRFRIVFYFCFCLWKCDVTKTMFCCWSESCTFFFPIPPLSLHQLLKLWEESQGLLLWLKIALYNVEIRFR